MFRYEAYDIKNRKVKGELSATDKADALQMLREKGLVPTFVVDSNSRTPEITNIWEKDFHFSTIYHTKVAKKRLYLLFNQLAMMVKAGVSLSFAMEILISGESNKTLKTILQEMEYDLQSGLQLSESMAKFASFSQVAVNVVAAGEMNGRLEDSFARIALMIGKDLALSGKIKTALAYPSFLLVLTVVVVIVLNTVVLPTFMQIYSQFGSELPLITRIVMGFSRFLTTRWYVLVGIFGGIIAFFYILSKQSERFCYERDHILLTIPILGNLLKKSYLASFLRTMESLTNAGVEIISALETSQRVVSSRYFQRHVEELIEQVKLGTPISDAMKRHPVFESMLVSMMRVGEESGMLSGTLEKMAELYEAQTEEASKTFTTVFEPAMTVMIALVVGVIVISVVYPMFNMYSVIGG